MRRASTAVQFLFYGGLLLVMAAIFTQVLGEVIPGSLGKSIGFNSEGYTLALVLAAWIQFARPRLLGTPREWPITIAVSLLAAGAGAALLASDLPSRFRTLNEACLAAAIALLYLQARRPLPRWVPFLFSGAVVALIVVFGQTSALTGVAETLGVLVILPLAVDVFDRRVLDPDEPASPALAYGFYLVLSGIIVALTVLERVQVDGAFGEVVHYVHRMQESFVAVLLVLVYFAILRALRESRDEPAGLAAERQRA